MDTRQLGPQRQRSASMFTNVQSATNIDPIQQQIDSFQSLFPSYRPVSGWDENLSSAYIAKPYRQNITPFPFELDKRYIIQERDVLVKKGKGRQMTPSEDARCFWAILSTRPSKGQGGFDVANFAFLHFDPKLEKSLGYSVGSLIDMSILDFVRSNEKTKIELDILQYIFEKDNKGTMIRCTMKSVMSMGRLVDSDYQLTDLRLESIGDDMLLCFFHAVDDRSTHDEVINGKRPNGPNWCETSLDTFNDQHCQLLWQHIFSQRSIEPFSSAIERHQSGFPKTIFQILTNGITTSNILFSWPPPRLFDSLSHHSYSSGTDSYDDGSYFADVLARPAFETNFRDENPSLSLPVTACARRQIKVVTITTDGLTIEFEVVLIPYGNIKFAIFSISRAEHVNQEAEYRSSKGDQICPVTFTPNYEAQPITIANSEQQQQTFFSQPLPDLAFSKSISSFYSMAAAPSPFTLQTPKIFHILPAAGTIDTAQMSEYGRRLSSLFNTTTSHHPFPYPMNDDKPYRLQPIQRRCEPSQKAGQITSSSCPVHRFRQHPSYFPESPIRRCLTCGSSKSPEWRKGPDGKNSLCNACGLRFSRNASRVRKKDEKARNTAEVVANGGVVPEYLHRKFEAERERKKVGFPKKIQQAQEHPLQQTAQMDTADLTGYANFSPDLDIQFPPSVHLSSTEVNTRRPESIQMADYRE